MLYLVCQLKGQEVQTNCITWKNSFVKIFKQNLNPEVFRFEIHSRQASGWMSITYFTKKESFQNSISVLSYLPNQFIQLTNHTTISHKKIFFEEKVLNQFYNKIDGIFTFSFKINSTDLQNTNFIVLSNNLHRTPYIEFNNTYIMKHDSFGLYNAIEMNRTNNLRPICDIFLNISGRFAAQHYIGMILSTLSFCIILILLIYFRNDQPLKSRFAGPYMVLGGIFVNLITEHVYVVIPYERSSQVYCFLTPLLGFNALQIWYEKIRNLIFFSFVVPCAMLVRYLIISLIHQNKRKIIQKLQARDLSEETQKIINIKFKKFKKLIGVLLKILSSHWIVLIFPVIWSLTFESIQIGILAFYNFHCSELVYSYQRIVHACFIGIVFFMLFVMCVFEIIITIPSFLRCQWKEMLVKKDPYHYRIDMMCFLPIIPLFAIWFFIALPSYIFSLNVEFIVILGFWTTGLQSLFITIIKKYYRSTKRSRMKKRSKETLHLDMILNKSLLLEIFIEYCELQWASENILLKLDIQEYKKSKERENLCLNIKENYLLVNVSDLEINCPSSIINKTLKMIDEKNFSDDLFMELEKVVDLNLSDTLSRFIYSSLYSKYLKDLEFENKILGL